MPLLCFHSMRFHRLHRRGVVSYLTQVQKEEVCRRFHITDPAALDAIILDNNSKEGHQVIMACCRLLGVKTYFPKWTGCRIRSGYIKGPKRSYQSP